MHPSRAPGAVRLYGRRVMLRPLTTADFPAYTEVRRRNTEWLVPWEPFRHPGVPDPGRDRDAFATRCTNRERERLAGASYAFGMFVDGRFCGEMNINNVQRGALQSATIGYWIDRARAGQAYTAEAVVIGLRFAFEELHLHRIEICIVPRNTRSRRVVAKIGLRDEGVAERYVEINGVWEDHIRYAITVEEWTERRDELAAAWL